MNFTAPEILTAHIMQRSRCPRPLASECASDLLAYVASLTVRADLAGSKRRAAALVGRVMRRNYEDSARRVARLITPPPAADFAADLLADVMEVLP